MFDIGFSEIVLIGIVALLVIGPEQLPDTVRTAVTWLNRIKRGFNEIKQEVQQELHNDAVMRELRKTGEQLKNETTAIGRDLSETITPPATDRADSSLQNKEQDKSTPENKSE
jgi:sec-independent protein translocase protein TatB